MHDNRDDYEPIIATRHRPRVEPEDSRPLWPLVLALAGGLVVVVMLAWWFMGREDASKAAQSEAPAPETFPEIQVQDDPLPQARDAEPANDGAKEQAPPARDSETDAEEAATSPTVTEPAPAAEPSAAAPESSEPVPESAVQVPSAPAAVQVSLVSPDPQVRFEMHARGDSNALVTGQAGETVTLAPGTYRVVASGAQLETLEREVTFDGQGPQEYSVELCAERKHERENLAGKVVEERACASTAQCESLFLVLGEEADQLVKDRDFRTRQCEKWRADSVPEGTWTLDTNCDGATAASTCRIQIGAGVCTFAEPPRTVRGTECPRAELR